jgi:hypothetical protein
MTCFHQCEKCKELFSHVPDCDGKYCAPEFGLCMTCRNEGYEMAYCPKCHDTRPINTHEFLCTGCLEKQQRTA